jgi:hypothetical protein
MFQVATRSVIGPVRFLEEWSNRPRHSGARQSRKQIAPGLGDDRARGNRSVDRNERVIVEGDPPIVNHNGRAPRPVGFGSVASVLV